MVIFLNKYLSDKKELRIALTSIYGLGNNLANVFCSKVGLSRHVKVNQVPESKLMELYRLIIQTYKLDYELVQVKNEFYKRKINIRCYKGLRYLYSLPANGQRTKTNAKTVKKVKFTKK
jgi:small subunit ribosomal protein S13